MDATTLPPLPSGRSARVIFTGTRRDFFRLVRRGAALELITAGLYRFWLATDIRRALWSGTSVDGDAPEYTGTAKELLIGFLFALAILVPIYVAYFLIGIEAERAKAFASIPLVLFFYAFGQFAIFRARRYRATRTVWRGVRFWMSGSGWAYSWRACLWTLLTLLTLGLALPWRESALERYKMRHLYYGSLEGRFDGSGWGLFKRGWWLWLLSLPIITVPFTYPAYKAVLWRWWLSGIRFGEVRFDSDLRTGAMMGLYWAVIGWVLLVLIIDGIVVSSVGFAVLLLSNGEVGAGALVELLREYPYVVLGANLVNYLVVALCAGIVVRVYRVRGVWERVVTSAVAHDLDRADDVRAEGRPVSALGEGLADGLDIAGF